MERVKKNFWKKKLKYTTAENLLSYTRKHWEI